MTDTTILEWKLLMKQLRESNALDSNENWKKLKRHEDYMVMKGFLIGFNKVITPQGETVCQQD